MDSPATYSQPFLLALLILTYTHISSAFIPASAGLGRPASGISQTACDVGSCTSCKTSSRQQLKKSAVIRAAEADGGLGGGGETEGLGLDGNWEIETGEVRRHCESLACHEN